MGKSTISMAIFNSYFGITRGYFASFATTTVLSAGVNLSSYRSAREKCDQRSPANPQVKRHWDEERPRKRPALLVVDGDFMGFLCDLPSGYAKIAIENGH